MEYKIYICKCCNKKWPSKTHYNRHLASQERSAARVKPSVTCTVCHRNVSKPSVLKGHIEFCQKMKIKREERQIAHTKTRYKILMNQFKNMIAKKNVERRLFIRNLNNILKKHVKTVRANKKRILI